jgi:hypothetical protein
MIKFITDEIFVEFMIFNKTIDFMKLMTDDKIYN